MTFRLGAKSRRELVGVHPDLVRLVERAIELTTQDFTVHDGLRTQEEQRRMVATGASRTMRSRHLTGHAVDLVPIVNGKPRWEWPLIYPIAEAMRDAAQEQAQPVCWGGLKGFARLDTFIARISRHTGWDGPHFELPRRLYP